MEVVLDEHVRSRKLKSVGDSGDASKGTRKPFPCAAVPLDYDVSMRWATLFILSVSVLLAVTALLKVFSAIDSAPYLEHNSQLVPISNRSLLLTAGAIELVGALLLSGSNTFTFKAAVAACIGLLFGAYRFVLWAGGFPTPCKCLGDATHWLGLSDATERHISLLVLLYITAGSAALLVLTFCKKPTKTFT